MLNIGFSFIIRNEPHYSMCHHKTTTKTIGYAIHEMEFYSYCQGILHISSLIDVETLRLAAFLYNNLEEKNKKT